MQTKFSFNGMAADAISVDDLPEENSLYAFFNENADLKEMCDVFMDFIDYALKSGSFGGNSAQHRNIAMIYLPLLPARVLAPEDRDLAPDADILAEKLNWDPALVQSVNNQIHQKLCRLAPDYFHSLDMPIPPLFLEKLPAPKTREKPVRKADVIDLEI
ncbi:MAG: hypothetical protein LRZ85_04485 [Alphaproteobacteria bacterium]|nr:hypothetical protein [Alphaproteobacteria bacterium]MCD8571474.1 hypothetical protein [Alphaproteobacteria bacterium]